MLLDEVVQIPDIKVTTVVPATVAPPLLILIVAVWVVEDGQVAGQVKDTESTQSPRVTAFWTCQFPAARVRAFVALPVGELMATLRPLSVTLNAPLLW